MDDQPRKQPPDPDLDFEGGDLSDDDPDVVAGIEHLAALRAAEHETVEFSRKRE